MGLVKWRYWVNDEWHYADSAAEARCIVDFVSRWQYAHGHRYSAQLSPVVVYQIRSRRVNPDLRDCLNPNPLRPMFRPTERLFGEQKCEPPLR